MSRDIRIVYCAPDKRAEIRTVRNDYETLHDLVQGYLEAVYPFEEEVCIVCNEEGKLDGLPFNRCLKYDNGIVYDFISGPFFICSCKGVDFGSLTQKQAEKYKDMYLFPERMYKQSGVYRSFKVEVPEG